MFINILSIGLMIASSGVSIADVGIPVLVSINSVSIEYSGFIVPASSKY